MNKLELDKEYKTRVEGKKYIIYEKSKMKNKYGETLYFYDYETNNTKYGITLLSWCENDDVFIENNGILIEQTWQEKYKEHIDGEFIFGQYAADVKDVWVINKRAYLIHVNASKYIVNTNDYNDYMWEGIPKQGIQKKTFDSIWNEKPKGDK